MIKVWWKITSVERSQQEISSPIRLSPEEKSNFESKFYGMQSLKTNILVTLFCCITYTMLWSQQNISSSIDSLFAGFHNLTPGYILTVTKQDEPTITKAYGMANLEHGIPISMETAFNVASLSKQFTGAAVALLILDNKLKLEDLVSDYIPDFPFDKDSLKIKHLVYMTSGINDYYYNPRGNRTDWSTLNFFNIDTAISASMQSGALMYAPGSQWSYSNINYMLLCKVVEEVSGVPFSKFLSQHIFEPLGMDHTLVNDDVFEVIPNRALGYNFRDDENTAWMIESGYLPSKGSGFLQIHRNSSHYGGSGIYTTMSDFVKWLENFHTKSLGGSAFYDLMHSTMKFQHDKVNDAFGLVWGEHDGKPMVWYEGGDWGFSAFMVRFPDQGLSIACFSNLGTGNARSKVWGVYELMKKYDALD